MNGKYVSEQWKKLNEDIAHALSAGGRTGDKVRVVGIGKKQDPEKIKMALSLGLEIVGENYVQEFKQKKKDLLGERVEWHFVGHLQRNKVKDLVGEVSLIQSVDRKELIPEISKRAEKKKRIQEILIEVNVDQEKQKSGVWPEEGSELIDLIQSHPSIRLQGLMALPAILSSEIQRRKSFARLRELSDRWKKLLNPGESGHQLKELSMGTSDDFIWAIQEGATMIRVGTYLFGSRK